jgi:hypothetical protein
MRNTTLVSPPAVAGAIDWGGATIQHVGYEADTTIFAQAIRRPA